MGLHVVRAPTCYKNGIGAGLARTEAAWGATLAARVPLLVLVVARTAGTSHAGADAEDLRLTGFKKS